MDSISEHILGFLRLYGTEFDFRKHAVSLHQSTGTILLRTPKKDKRTPEQLKEQHEWLHNYEPRAPVEESGGRRGQVRAVLLLYGILVW